jgi:hypothetical protein
MIMPALTGRICWVALYPSTAALIPFQVTKKKIKKYSKRTASGMWSNKTPNRVATVPALQNIN